MGNKSWIRFLSEMDNLRMFSLCKEFDNLSLEDNTAAEASSSSSSVVQGSSSFKGGERREGRETFLEKTFKGG